MVDFIIAFFAFILSVSILVTFHEFGHFWVARRCGVKVLRFSVGFGKTLWSWRDKQHTEYRIALIPLGGYVKMLDEREGEVIPDEQPFAFNRKPVLTRFAIVSAGPLFNFLFAIILYWLMFIIGISGSIPLIGEVKPDSIAANAGLMAGEEIIAIDGVPTLTWQQVIRQIVERLGDKNTLEIQAQTPEGRNKHTHLNLQSWVLEGTRPDALHALGIEPYQPPIPPVVYEVMEGEPASKIGLLPEDRIIAANGKPISKWQDFTNVIIKHIDKPVTILIERDHETKKLVITPRAKVKDTGETIGFVGLIVKTLPMPETLLRKERWGPIDALGEAIKKTYEYIVLSFKMIGKMLVGAIDLRSLSGPITIAETAGASVSIGFQYYLSFLAIVSISLGVLNLLPIPILDGGHLFFYLIEMIIQRPIPQQVQQVGFKLGMLFLIFLMSIAFYNDIVRLM